MNKAVAKLKNNSGSPRKMRYVADAIRGLDVEKALGILKFSKKHAAKSMEKTLRSAIANWTAKNPEADIDACKLFIAEILVDGGRILRRFNPAPQGRAYRIRKRSNHITLVIDARIKTQQPALAVIENQEVAK